MKTAPAKTPKAAKSKPAIRTEYSFAGGARGKYAARYAAGTNVVVLKPAVAAAFPDSKSVNDALEALLRIADRPRKASV